MIKTYNRIPKQVNVPSTSPTSYFIQTDWKGINENKNYLLVDQQSFQSSDNVYVNNDGLLQTRPALKTIPNNITETITNVQIFNDIIVYICSNILYFYRNTDLLYRFVATNSENTLLEEGGKIFVFSWDRLSYFDTIIDAFVEDASDKIYIPEYVGSGTDTTNEPKNLLTDAKRYTYLLTKGGVAPADFIGKRVDITIDANNNTVTYDNYTTASYIFGKYNTELYTYGLSNWKFSDNDRILFANGRILTYLHYDVETGTEISKRIDVPTDLTLSAFSNDGGIAFFTQGIGTSKSIYYLDLTQSSSSSSVSELNITKGEDEEILVVDAVDADNISVLTRDVSNAIRWYTGGIASIEQVPGTYSHNIQDVLKSKLYLQGSVRKHVVTSYDNYTRKYYIYISPDVFQSVDGTILDFCENVNEECVYVAIYNGYNVFIDKYNYNNEVTAVGVIATDSFDVLLEKDGSGNATGNVYIGTSKYVLGSGDQYYLYDVLKISNESGRVLPVFVSNTSVYYYDTNGRYVDEDYFAAYHKLYSSTRWSTAELSRQDGISYKYPFSTNSKIAKLDRWYVSYNNKVYVSKPKYSTSLDFLWYFPETSYNKFNSVVTNVHILSKTEVGIFLENELWYATYDNENDLCHFVKSKIQGGCKSGADVTTTFDGKYIVFPTERGLAYLTYQDFVATTEQSLTFLSDSIVNSYDKLAEMPIKLFKYKYWIYCYNSSDFGLLLDLRNMSWWKFSFPIKFKTITNYEENVLALSDGTLLTLEQFSTKDDCENGNNIDWKLVSQKLHFNTINNYKHVYDMFINFVSDYSQTNSIKLQFEIFDNLQITTKSTTIEYGADAIKSFVKKLNLLKVYALQYTIQSDDANAIPESVAITSISIKYGVKGQVK